MQQAKLVWFDATSGEGEVSGDDVLGGICASKLEDVTTCMEEHGMVANALSELAGKVERLVVAVGV